MPSNFAAAALPASVVCANSWMPGSRVAQVRPVGGGYVEGPVDVDRA